MFKLVWRQAKAMLDADTTVKAENKHLVLVTDGVTYLWGTGANPKRFTLNRLETMKNVSLLETMKILIKFIIQIMMLMWPNSVMLKVG